MRRNIYEGNIELYKLLEETTECHYNVSHLSDYLASEIQGLQ